MRWHISWGCSNTNRASCTEIPVHPRPWLRLHLPLITTQNLLVEALGGFAFTSSNKSVFPMGKPRLFHQPMSGEMSFQLRRLVFAGCSVRLIDRLVGAGGNEDPGGDGGGEGGNTEAAGCPAEAAGQRSCRTARALEFLCERALGGKAGFLVVPFSLERGEFLHISHPKTRRKAISRKSSEGCRGFSEFIVARRKPQNLSPDSPCLMTVSSVLLRGPSEGPARSGLRPVHAQKRGRVLLIGPGKLGKRLLFFWLDGSVTQINDSKLEEQ